MAQQRPDDTRHLGGAGHDGRILCLADGRGRPVAFAPTPRNVADISMALPLLQAVVPPKRLITDKAYDAQTLRDWLKSRKLIATIPSTANLDSRRKTRSGR